jgi:uncharacterized protein YndB with AHSA1/START domain
MSDTPAYVYVTYITATPEKVWEGLTSPDFTEKYWFGWRMKSDWKVGAKVMLEAPKNSGANDIKGTIAECDPPNRLVYSWHEDDAGREHPARITFELKQMGKTVRLTVTHADITSGDIDPNPDTFKGVNTVWPAVLSGLKSLVETGQALSLG